MLNAGECRSPFPYSVDDGHARGRHPRRAEQRRGCLVSVRRRTPPPLSQRGTPDGLPHGRLPPAVGGLEVRRQRLHVHDPREV